MTSQVASAGSELLPCSQVRGDLPEEPRLKSTPSPRPGAAALRPGELTLPVNLKHVCRAPARAVSQGALVPSRGLFWEERPGLGPWQEPPFLSSAHTGSHGAYLQHFRGPWEPGQSLGIISHMPWGWVSGCRLCPKLP